jgi:hypothetical protein
MYWGPPPKVPQEPKKVKRLIPLKLRVDRGKNRRYYLIKKNDQARYWLPLTPHKKGEKVWYTHINIHGDTTSTRLRRKHKEIMKQNFWKLRFHETVIWELKKKKLDKEICEREREMEELLAQPSRCDNHEVEVLKKHWWRQRFEEVMNILPSTVANTIFYPQ